MKITTLSTALAAVLSMAMVGQANAYTSAGGKIEIQNLTVDVFDAAGNEITFLPGTITSFLFTTTNTATLNGTTIVDSDNCAGVPAANTCNAAPPRLDSDLQLLGGSGHTENDFTLDGPNAAGQPYSYADSAILTAQLSGDASTSAGVITETEISGNGDGNASAILQSTTGFSFDFTVGPDGPYSITVSFEANGEAYSESDNPGAILAIAQGDISANTSLNQLSGGTGNAEWNPDGELNGCSSLNGGVTCSGEVDPTGESLNVVTSISTDPASVHHSEGEVFFDYSITFNNLTEGQWSFALAAQTNTSVIKRVQVPEPGVLLLVASGLIGMGATTRRRRNKQA